MVFNEFGNWGTVLVGMSGMWTRNTITQNLAFEITFGILYLTFEYLPRIKQNFHIDIWEAMDSNVVKMCREFKKCNSPVLWQTKNNRFNAKCFRYRGFGVKYFKRMEFAYSRNSRKVLKYTIPNTSFSFLYFKKRCQRLSHKRDEHSMSSSYEASCSTEDGMNPISERIQRSWNGSSLIISHYICICF